jgi:hypothetical protein
MACLKNRMWLFDAVNGRPRPDRIPTEHSVPKIKCIEDVRKLRGQREINSPNADKFDVDVN